MLFSTAILFAPFAAAAVARLNERDTCSDVHLFLARGNGEAYPGRVGQLADAVCSGLPSCDFENIIFTSTEVYCDQVADGATSGVSQIASYASRCPHSKIVLGGYSLGAQVVGDILGSGGGSFYGCNERNVAGLSPGTIPGSQISAALLFGDVRHVANEPYNVGDGSGDEGQYPRSGGQLSNLNQFSGLLRSYCLASDPICALGDDGYSHTTYMDVFANDAGAWVQQLLNLKGSASSSPVVVPTTSTTSTSTTSSSPTAAASTTSTSATTSSSSDESASSTTASAAASSTSAPTTTSMSVPGTTTSSSENSSLTSSSSSSSSSTSSSTSSTSLVPFVFTDTPSSTVTAVSVSSTFAPTPRVSTTSTTTNLPSPIMATSSSKAGAYANGAQVTINLLTLVVIKVLVF